MSKGINRTMACLQDYKFFKLAQSLKVPFSFAIRMVAFLMAKNFQK